MRFNECLNTSHHGRLHLFKVTQVVTDSLTGYDEKCNGDMPLHCQQKLNTQGILGVPTGKNPEDSNQVSMEAMQWVHLYLSVGDDRCY
jgi:hypothetical protein